MTHQKSKALSAPWVQPIRTFRLRSKLEPGLPATLREDGRRDLRFTYARRDAMIIDDLSAIAEHRRRAVARRTIVMSAQTG